MFKSLFADNTPRLKAMEPKHIERAVDIISQTDEDDAEEALASFNTGGVGNKFVLMRNGVVVGITGYAVDDHVDDVAWLSWHYLDRKLTGHGLGSQMFEELLGHLNNAGFRLLLIETSDYQEDGAPLYGAAHRMYERFGANLKVTVPDYYALGEAKLIYGLENQDRPALDPAGRLAGKTLSIAGLDADPECDGVLGIRWEEGEGVGSGPDGGPNAEALRNAVADARAQRARSLVLILPQDLSEANETAISGAGFRPRGQLADFYAKGEDQVWWSLAP